MYLEMASQGNRVFWNLRKSSQVK